MAADGAPMTGSTDRAAWRRVLTDVSVVTVTPFAGDRLERVDHEGMARNIEHLVTTGVRLLVAGGNTGEFTALAGSEVIAAVRTHVEVVAGRAKVIAGVGYRLEDAIGLGRLAMEAGADGIMVHQPIHPYASEDGLGRYYEAVADALAGVPLILYLRNPRMSAEAMRRLGQVGSVVGVKMGLPDVDRFVGLAAAAPDLAWVCGLAEGWAVPFAAAGAIGYTSGLANFAPRRSLELQDCLRAGDLAEAERLFEHLRPIEDLRAARDGAANVAVVKAAMDLLGLAGGDSRPPLSGLDPDERSTLVRILHEMELLR
jgi:4-hydroxy-tetrahydrodipicolinate synthase